MHKSYVFWNQIYDNLPRTPGKVLILNHTSYLVILLLNPFQGLPLLKGQYGSQTPSWCEGLLFLPSAHHSAICLHAPNMLNYLWFQCIFSITCSLVVPVTFCLWRQQGEMFRSKFLGSTVSIEILTLLIISCTITIYVTWEKYQPMYAKFPPTQNGEHVHPYILCLSYRVVTWDDTWKHYHWIWQESRYKIYTCWIS